jgi:hypothetical protein
MRKRNVVRGVTCALLVLTVASCKNAADPTSVDETQAASTVDVTKSTAAVRTVLASNSATHEAAADYTWDATRAARIVLNGNSITESSDSATVTGTTVTITSGGTYSFSGSLTNGQIAVNASDGGTVWLILNGVTISNSTTAPISIAKAAKVVVVLTDNTQNSLTDASTYVSASADEDEPNAALFSKTDLTICGNGSLTVKGNYNDGIASKDGLIIKGGTITVTAVDDGIRGKDYLVIEDGVVTVTATGDALKSDNDEDATRGYIYMESGTLTATSGGDGLAAETDAIIANGTLTLTSGGGSSKTVSGTTSSKGIKGVACIVIGDGTFNISSADDAIHSNGLVVINGGTFAIATGDDAVHSDSLVGINGGTMVISKCYEGIEGTTIVINDGNIHITASDDGINGAGGNDGSGAAGWPGGVSPSSNRYLYVNGGYIVVSAVGDGIDVNGSIVMTGGTVLVNGPTSNGNGPLDYDASFKMTGGTIVAAGSSGMAQAPGATSTQCAILMIFSTAKTANSLFHIQASDGTDILTFKPTKTYQSVAYSSPKLVKGSTYDVYLGGSSTGTASDGLYEGGTYSGGTKSTSFTVSSTVTRISG